jgi:hypothetical protein
MNGPAKLVARWSWAVPVQVMERFPLVENTFPKTGGAGGATTVGSGGVKAAE